MTYAAEGNRNTATRIANAENDFVDYLVNAASISAKEARKVMAFYLKKKFAKLDAVGGRISVKHGAFLDRDVILRAVATA